MLLVAWPLGGKYATIGGSTSQCAVRSCLRVICLCCGYILYLVLGAAVFSALEVSEVDSNLVQLSTARTKLQRTYPMLQGMLFLYDNKDELMPLLKFFIFNHLTFCMG